MHETMHLLYLLWVLLSVFAKGDCVCNKLQSFLIWSFLFQFSEAMIQVTYLDIPLPYVVISIIKYWMSFQNQKRIKRNNLKNHFSHQYQSITLDFKMN